MRGSPTYDDLVIRLEPGSSPRSYQARVISSPCGSSEAVALSSSLFERPGEFWESLDSTIWRSSLAEPARDVGRPHAARPNVFLPALGKELFEAVFAGPIREIFLRCIASVGSQEGRRLRISLDISQASADELGALPWELLYRFETRDYLSRSVRTPLIRRLQTQRLQLTPRPISALRILIVLSNPRRHQMLNVVRERELIEEALGSLAGVELDFLEGPTLSKLGRKVNDRSFDVLHFVGHGGFDAEGEGILCFEEANQPEAAVTGSVLADTLKDIGSLRMVFLNACETGRLPRTASGRDPYEGVASALLMAGIPAVVAMQFPITDRAAADFSGKFYEALAHGDPLEIAMVRGRKWLYGSRPSSWEWATPVLFLGVPHGNLFEIRASEKAAEKVKATADPAGDRDGSRDCLQEALELLDYQRYDRALEALDRAVEDSDDKASALFYRALARLGGRRPRSASPGVIRSVEADLWEAKSKLRGQEPAHLWLFEALIKHDFYRMNGLRLTPPTVEELLEEATAAPLGEDPGFLERLLKHAPTPSNPVRQALDRALSELRSQ